MLEKGTFSCRHIFKEPIDPLVAKFFPSGNQCECTTFYPAINRKRGRKRMVMICSCCGTKYELKDMQAMLMVDVNNKKAIEHLKTFEQAVSNIKCLRLNGMVLDTETVVQIVDETEEEESTSE